MESKDELEEVDTRNVIIFKILHVIILMIQ